ncbi:hypothetical protein NC651_015820 [Populus alba x Populus x berolinensis]|nr:hypothetical protein NC651_015820 [Populus alba x Populus x berolinensis]
MEPPNKDSFFLSLAFCIEAYNMNLDGTLLQNLAIAVEHEDFPGKVAKVGKIQVRRARRLSPGVSLTTYLLDSTDLKPEANRLCPIVTILQNLLSMASPAYSCIKLTFSMDFHHTGTLLPIS